MALEDDAAPEAIIAFVDKCICSRQMFEPSLLNFFRDIGNLKRLVSFDATAGVVVNCLSGMSESLCCQVVFAQDDHGIGAFTLKRDSHSHLG